VISPTTGDDKAADVVIWKPNLTLLDRKPAADHFKTYARIMDSDVSIPRERLLRKGINRKPPAPLFIFLQFAPLKI
jgi:hypothetical protein